MTLEKEDPEITAKYGFKLGDPATFDRVTQRQGRVIVRGIIKGFWSGMVCLKTTETETGHYQGWPQHFRQNAELSDRHE